MSRTHARRARFFDSYVDTIIQRDLSTIAQVHDQVNVRNLLSAVASTSASLTNFDGLARDLTQPRRQDPEGLRHRQWPALSPDRRRCGPSRAGWERSPAWSSRPLLRWSFGGRSPGRTTPRASPTTATGTAVRSTSSSNAKTAPSSPSRSRPPPRRRPPTIAVCGRTCGTSWENGSRRACCSTPVRARSRSGPAGGRPAVRAMGKHRDPAGPEIAR